MKNDDKFKDEHYYVPVSEYFFLILAIIVR